MRIHSRSTLRALAQRIKPSRSYSAGTSSHATRVQRRRADVLRRALARSADEPFPVTFLSDFARVNVPQLTESELTEFEHVLMLDQPMLRQLVERPGTQRPVYIGENYTLDRFLNMVRHRIGKRSRV